MTGPTRSRKSGQRSTDQDPLRYRDRYDHSIEVFQCDHCGEWHPDQRTADDCCDLVDRLFDPEEVEEIEKPDTEDADTEESSTEPHRSRSPPAKFLSIQMTGLGYEYVRDRSGDSDETVYLHQLIVIAAGADPQKVFSSEFDVHHRNQIPWDNRLDNLELEARDKHFQAHLNGRDPEVDA